MQEAVRAIRQEIESFGEDGKPARSELAESSPWGVASLKRRLLRRLAFSAQHSINNDSGATPVAASCVPEVAVFAYVAKCLLNAGARPEECLTFLGATPTGLKMRKHLHQRTIWLPDVLQLSPLCHDVLSLLTMVAAIPICRDDLSRVPPVAPQASRRSGERSVRPSEDKPEGPRAAKDADAHASTMPYPRSAVEADRPPLSHLDCDDAQSPRVSESMSAHDVVNGGEPPPRSVACQAHESRVRMGGRDDSLKDNDASCTENPSVIETFSPRHAETTYPSCVDAVDIMTSRETRHSRKCVRADTKDWFGATKHADVSTLIKKHVNGEASKASKSRTIGMLVLFDEPLGIALLRSVGSLPKLEALSCAQRTSWCSFDVALDFVRGKKTVSEKQLYERLKIASDHYHASTRSYWEEAEVDVARALESSAIEELLHCVGNKVLVKMDAEQLTSQMQQDEMNEAVNNCGFYKDEITRLAASLIHEKSTIAQLETACAELQSTMSYDELTDRVEALKKLIKKTRKPPKKM